MRYAATLTVSCILMMTLTATSFAGGGKNKSTNIPPRFVPIHNILEKLDLSDAQVKSIGSILDEAEKQVIALRKEAKSKTAPTTAPATRVRAILTETIAKIEIQLTPKQRREFRQDVRELREKNAAVRKDAKGNVAV